jgi:hypothetical protein
LALIGSAYNDDGSGTAFVARVSPDRKASTVVRTSPYAPSVVAVATDGNIWTVGDTFLDEMHDSSVPNVVKVFSPEGKLVRTFSVSVRAGSLRGDAVSGSVLTCSKERVVWMTNGNEYIEFSLGGQEIYRTDGPPLRSANTRPWARFAVSWAGQAVQVEGSGTETRVWLLNRSSGSWTPAKRTFADSVLVVGFEGADLVTIEVDDHLERIFNSRTIGVEPLKQ